MVEGKDLLICKTCATQYDVPASSPLKNCRICDDPRQYVPPSGQVWTSLAELHGKYENKWAQDAVDKRIHSIWTEPKFGIGQRAILLETPEGNVLWDLIAYLDDKTIDFVSASWRIADKHDKFKGWLEGYSRKISHPHYYTTHAEWSKAFGCPVYVSAEDREWLNRGNEKDGSLKFIDGRTETILPGVTAVKCGGHFDGSLVLHWENKLFVADTMGVMPSGLYHVDRLPGTTSFSFMWSYPNLIPLPPSEIHKIWQAVKPFDFDTVHGAFYGTDIRSAEVKKRVLESMKIQVRWSGHEKHAILDETYP